MLTEQQVLEAVRAAIANAGGESLPDGFTQHNICVLLAEVGSGLVGLVPVLEKARAVANLELTASSHPALFELRAAINKYDRDRK